MLGETGRSLKTRKSEHIRNVKLSKKGSNVAKHAWTQDHIIDFANQSRSRLDKWAGLKSIVFTVCEHEYMNMSPSLIESGYTTVANAKVIDKGNYKNLKTLES